MSTESENLYTKNDQLIAQIYDNLSGENKSEEAISLLLNPNHISPTEQVKILGLLGEKDERFHSLLIKTVLNNINILDNNESFKIINNHFIQLVNQAYLLNDNAIMKICQDLFYLISQGVAAFYPYIWILLKNHGHITTYTDKKLRTINHYAVVFSFDGYNAKSIREILKSNCILCSEQALSAFKTVKTKKEYSKIIMGGGYTYNYKLIIMKFSFQIVFTPTDLQGTDIMPFPANFILHTVLVTV